MKRLITICAVVGVVLGVSNITFAAPVIENTGTGWVYTAGGGFNDVGFAVTKEWEARARADNSGWEIAVGKNVAVAGENNWANMTWLQNTSYGFSLTFSGDTATLTIGNGPPTVSYSGLVAPTDLYLQAKANGTRLMTASDLVIDGLSFGPLSDTGGTKHWIHIGNLSTAGFTLTGTLSGDFYQSGASENVAFDMIAGVPEPATICLLGLGALSLLRNRKA
jgi:hypothetical protein